MFTFLGSPVCSFNVINTQSHCFLASVVAAETSVVMLTLALGYDLSFLERSCFQDLFICGILKFYFNVSGYEFMFIFSSLGYTDL